MATACAINNIGDRAEAAILRRQLEAYLVIAATKDKPALARGEVVALPSAKSLDRFEDSLHRYAYKASTPKLQASSLVSASAGLNQAAAAVSAVSQRSLPTLLAILLLVTATLSAAVMRISTALITRPVLTLAWCVVPTLSIAVVMALDDPFAGEIGVNLQPLSVVVERLRAHF